MTEGASQQRPRTPTAVVSAALATAFCLTGDSMLYIALPLFWQQAGLDALWQVGVLLSANRLVRLPLNPLIGLFYHRATLRSGLLLAVLFGVASTLGYAFVSGFWAWLALRALWGVAWSLFRIGGLTCVVQCAPGNARGRVMGSYNGLYRLGSLVGMLVGGALVPVFGLQSIALVFAALSLLGIPLLLAAFDPQPALDAPVASSHATAFPRRALPGQRLVWLNGFCVALLIQGVLAATLSALVAWRLGPEIEVLGVALGAGALAGALQAVRWSWETPLAVRIGTWSDGPRGRLPLLTGALLGMGLGFAALLPAQPIASWLACGLLAMLAATALTTFCDALAADLARQGNALRGMTGYSIIQDLGAAVGPMAAFALLALPGGFLWLYGGSAALCLLLALGWWRELRPR